MSAHRFGVSSRLFKDVRLCRDHLVHIAAHGFEVVELYAAPTHFDARDAQAMTEFAEWLSDTRLTLHSVHLPTSPSPDDIDALLGFAAAVPFRFLVVHPGPAMKQTLERAVERAAAHHVSLAIEVMNDPRFDAATLVTLLEEDFEDLELGICLDFGHAHLRGDLNEAIETVSGHMVTTHLHDNAGRQDDHRVPYGGTIHWDSAMMEVQKIGYDGVLLFEPAAVQGDPVVVLKRCVAARERLERTFVTF